MIFEQKPYAQHANNLRGQIFRELKKGRPPATELPQVSWPSRRIWSLLVHCWDAEPSSRPSAFVASHMLKCTTMTFPSNVVRRIMHFVASLYADHPTHYRRTEWYKRCECLRALCLVSRKYRILATQFLYRDIRILLDANSSSLHSLFKTITGSAAQLHPFDHSSPNDYGDYTEILAISMSNQAFYTSNTTQMIRDIISRMPSIQLVIIRASMSVWETKVETSNEMRSLTTLEINGLNPWYILVQDPGLDILHCVHRLCIHDCPESPETFVSIAGNLWDITIHADQDPTSTAEILTTLADWILPQLRSLHLTFEALSSDVVVSLIPFFTKQGPRLRHLTIKVDDQSIPPIADIISLSSNLLSVDISVSSLDIRTAVYPHPTLETICFQCPENSTAHWIASEAGFTLSDTSLERFYMFVGDAERFFPRLVHAKVKWFYSARDEINQVFASFRTKDDFIVISDGKKAYKRYHGGRVEEGARTSLLC